MVELELTQGYVTVLDKEDLHLVSNHKWSLHNASDKNLYAISGEDGKNNLMHRVILGITDPNIKIDHRDGDGLNNRRMNLRICTMSQNQWNVGIRQDNTSGFKGVSKHKSSGKWRARITAHNKVHYLGHYKTPEEAYAAYCSAALELHGEFARVT